MDNYAIELLHITKVFPGIVANDDITLRVRYGEIHALLGENGAVTDADEASCSAFISRKRARSS